MERRLMLYGLALAAACSLLSGICLLGRAFVRSVLIAVVVAAVAFTLPAAAQGLLEELEELQAKFELFAACQPTALIVEGLRHEDVITKSAIQNAAESRLRAARIYTDLGISTPYLYINVNVGAGPAFGIHIEFKKWMSDEYGNDGLAAAWSTGTTGTHGGDGSYILSIISEHMDKFIVEYFRANDEACQ